MQYSLTTLPLSRHSQIILGNTSARAEQKYLKTIAIKRNGKGAAYRPFSESLHMSFSSAEMEKQNRR
ncbi:hypothetical protein E2C01_091224 [Portunus trituberculatus]|uniref:Uncharacterized protein n=1 Tax=Portunus trituberculatus TaxID=210409 RepID=A0A5B7JDE7_PORTR|nr:hypothetical protein [Portunus trituberculatus]